MFAIALICTVLTTCDDLPTPILLEELLERTSYVNVPKVNPLMPSDLQRWGRLLAASDAQVQHLCILYRPFVKSHNELVKSLGPEVLQQAKNVASIIETEGSKSPRLVDATRRLHSSTRRLFTSLEHLEIELTYEVAKVCTDVQCDSFDLIRNETSRRFSRNFPDVPLWGKVELRKILEAEECEDVWNAASPLAALVADYEYRVTPLLRRMSTAHWLGTFELSQLIEKHERAHISTEDFWNRYHILKSRKPDFAKTIGKITQDTLAQIVLIVDERKGQRIIEAVKCLVFPELYPDSNDLFELFDAALTDPSVTEEFREALRTLRMVYQRDYREICVGMEELCTQWQDGFMRGLPGFQPQFLGAKLQPLLEQRLALSRDYRRRLCETLGVAVVEALEQALSGHH